MKKFFEKAKVFLKEVIAEGQKVTWPGKKEVLGSTLVVIMLIIILAVFIGLVDFVLSRVISLLM